MNLQKIFFLCRYFLLHHNSTVLRLSGYGLTNIKPYRINCWYTGDDCEKTIRKYYIAKYNNIKCFIKLSTSDSTIKNEIFVNDYITKSRVEFVPRTLLFDYEYEPGSSLLATQFREGLKKFELPENEDDFEKICYTFIQILDIFAKYKIIHGDISDSNLLLDDKGNIVLIDFGIGRVPGSEQFEIDYIAHDGNYFQVSGNRRIYDDAYSFIKMLDNCGIPQEYKNMECYKKIVDLIGKHRYEITLP